MQHQEGGYGREEKREKIESEDRSGSTEKKISDTHNQAFPILLLLSIPNNII